jgi:hypothetical protein
LTVANIGWPALAVWLNVIGVKDAVQFFAALLALAARQIV